MSSSMKTHQGVMSSGIFIAETTASSVQRNTVRRKLFNNQFRILILAVVSFFSHMAYSIDAGVCQPTGFMNRIYVNANITITPAGYGQSVTYTDSTPVAQAGPITCQSNYTPTGYTVLTMSPSGGRFPAADASMDLGHGFSVVLTPGSTPGMSSNVNRASISGNTANIPSNIYPSFSFYPSGSPAAVQDIILHNYFVGYIATEGVPESDMFVPSDKTGLTAVYLSGHLHVPPYCTYMSDQPSLTIPMGTYFASDFAAAGVGGKVGQPQRIAGSGECKGGSSSGEGDLVHISVGSFTPGDGNDTLGIAGQPDIGVQVFDDQGNRLQVNGPYSGQAYTSRSLKGDVYVGKFDFPLNFQLVSRTGKVPSHTGTFTEYVTIDLFMD